tara:strand:+ start:546 stop:1061 length:516 start_codon:yes stop_codon:yes gene_type:complete
MNEQSSNTLGMPLAFFDQESCSWRMSQGSLLSEDAPSLERLPASGMTRGLELFELPTLVLPTSETDGSVLLPTPNAGVFNDSETPESWQARKDRQNNYAGTPLPIAVKKLLPTPTVEQGRNETSGRPVDSQHHPGVTLQDVAYKMAGRGESTPQPSDTGNKSLEEQHLTLW